MARKPSRKLLATNLEHDAKTIRRFYSKVIEAKVVDRVELQDFPECWLWQGATTDSGYSAFLVRNSELGDVAIDGHRLSYRINYGPIPTDKLYYVNHQCDIRRCIRPEHLYLGSSKENSADRVNRGRSGQSNLTDVKVKKIREMYESDPTPQMKKQLAEATEVTVRTIEDIINHKTWQHVK